MPVSECGEYDIRVRFILNSLKGRYLSRVGTGLIFFRPSHPADSATVFVDVALQGHEGLVAVASRLVGGFTCNFPLRSWAVQGHVIELMYGGAVHVDSVFIFIE